MIDLYKVPAHNADNMTVGCDNGKWFLYELKDGKYQKVRPLDGPEGLQAMDGIDCGEYPKADVKCMVDAAGNNVKARDKVFVSRHISRGLDCACVGTVESISESGQSALVKITSDLKHLSETVKDYFEYYEFNDIIRVKYTKLILKRSV